MGIEIKHLDPEESIRINHFLDSYAFTPTPPLPEFDAYAEKRRKMKGIEHYAVLVDDEPLTIASAINLTQNIRGKILNMGGIASVASHPAARRKGYVKTLLQHIFIKLKENENTVSCLYPFKESFYQRFGYIPLPQAKKVIFTPNKLALILNMEIKGRLEMVKFCDGYVPFREYLLEHQKNTHGMALFAEANPEAAMDHDSWLVFAKYQNQVVGVMQYVLKGKTMDQHLLAYDFLFSSPRGKYLLLEWIARHIDQVGRVELALHPAIMGENLFTDITPQHEGLFLPPMGRVIDVKGLAGLPVGKGQITLNISDPYCKWNNGIWRFNGSDGKLIIQESEKPDCELSIQALAALVYGVCDPEEFIFRNWGNPNDEQQTILQQMFPPAVPFLLAMY